MVLVPALPNEPLQVTRLTGPRECTIQESIRDSRINSEQPNSLQDHTYVKPSAVRHCSLVAGYMQPPDYPWNDEITRLY